MDSEPLNRRRVSPDGQSLDLTGSDSPEAARARPRGTDRPRHTVHNLEGEGVMKPVRSMA